jgi:CheY-like chemotaxis protein
MSNEQRSPYDPGLRRDFKAPLIKQRFPSELKGRSSAGFVAKGPFCPLISPLTLHNSTSEAVPVPLNITFKEGSGDRASEADLTGCRILVVEDDFLLAAETEHVLRRAGAEVLGPVGQEEQALALIATRLPTCALLDINLGEGRQFGVADVLKASRIPFMFVTGYDDVMIPERFSNIGRMRKPIDFRLVLRAAAQMCLSAR